MRLATFHHLTGYECFPGASDGKYLLLPFKTAFQKTDKAEKTNYDIKCKNDITFLILSILEDTNETDKSRFKKFPYEFSFLLHPVTFKDSGYNYIGPITFVPGKRNTMYFMAVLGTQEHKPEHKLPILSKIDICLFVIDPPIVNLSEFKKAKINFAKNNTESDYLKNIVEVKDGNLFKKILLSVKPTKKYKYNSTHEVKKIIFMSDDRHFLVVSEHEVLMYQIENEVLFEPKIIFPSNFKILNCDYRNDTLLVLVESNEKIPNQEVMFFNLQDKQIFRLDTTNDNPSYSIYIRKRILNRQYKGLNIIANDKEGNEEKKNTYIHNTTHIEFGFTIFGCKFLPGDNNYISLILYEGDSKKIFVYFFKLNVSDEVRVEDVYKINSICLIQDEEIYSDIQKFFPYESDKDWFDICGEDNEFEFGFMFFWQIIVRFHFIFDRISSVEFIDVTKHTEENCGVIVPDQQTEDESFKYLPFQFKSKSKQTKVFNKDNKQISIKWLKILGPKPSVKPFFFHIDKIDPNVTDELLAQHSGFRTFATFDVATKT